MFTVEEMKKIAKLDPNFEENTEKWEVLFEKISNNDEKEDEYKQKYEELKAKYISRFEQKEDNEKVKEVKEKEEIDDISIEDILD